MIVLLLGISAQPKSAEAGQEPFIGEIVLFAGNFAPRGWALCDGQLLPISQYQALFSILGTQFGGDGRSYFALPDLRGRAPIHAGNGPGLTNRNIGAKGGTETVTLNTTQIPSHNHTAYAADAFPDQTSPQNMMLAKKNRTHQYHAPTSTNLTMNQQTIGNTGGSQAHNNMPPFLTINYIIALQGVFPSRN